MSKNIIFLNSHPVQYFVPLYEKLSNDGIQLNVWYCSDENIHSYYDRQFGKKINWDIPLLKGYEYKFFKNYSYRKSIYGGFWGLINLGVIKELFKIPKSLIIIHGWSYFTHIIVIIFGKLFGHTVSIRGESPYIHEIKNSFFKIIFKTIFINLFLKSFIDIFFFIGEQNRKFYKYYNIKDTKLVFLPYAVDNKRFQNALIFDEKSKSEIKFNLGLPQDKKILLFSGKFISKKRPLDLLKAYVNINKKNEYALVMLGDGILKREMEQFIISENLINVFLPGFINQSKITEYYNIADIFIMTSDIGETWGLVANEAMNFGVPLLLSDMVGCSEDLITEKTGTIFNCGNILSLETKISFIENKSFNKADILNLVNNYSYEKISETLKKYCNY